jgi:multidrug efflux system membrane fusion protein
MNNSSPNRRLLLILLSFSLGLAGCAKPPPVADTGPPEVTVSRPIQRKVTDSDYYTGRIEPVETVEVRARIRGHLIKVAFQDGAEVKKGALLFEIDPRPYEAALEAAKAALKSAQASQTLFNAEYKRTAVLVTQRAASREELDVAQGKRDVAAADVGKAQAAVDKAKLDLEYTRVTAPIDGRISQTYVTVGNLINAGGGETLLTTLVRMEPMYVNFDVDERALLRYLEDRNSRDGKMHDAEHIKDLKIPVWLGLANQEGYPRKGSIDFADNHVDPRTGTIRVRGVFSNEDRVLAPGMFARVRIQSSDPYLALLVTDRAIGTNQGQKYVYVVDAENKVEERPIKLGPLSDGLRVVQEGLKPDDWVVVKGMQRVREGMEVTRKEGPMPGATVVADARPAGAP